MRVIRMRVGMQNGVAEFVAQRESGSSVVGLKVGVACLAQGDDYRVLVLLVSRAGESSTLYDRRHVVGQGDCLAG